MQIIKTNLDFNMDQLAYMGTITDIVFHHTEGVGQSVEAIHRYHRYENGWAGIGYHFYVRKDGSVYQGRPLLYSGSHCPGKNSCGIGISFEGNFMKEYMTPEQIQAGNELVAYLKAQYGNLNIGCHRDYYNTDCPGTNFPTSQMMGCSSGNVSITDQIVNAADPYGTGRVFVGARCKELQEKLIACGYSCGGYGVDGSFGKGTYDSLIQFQKDHGVSADGLAGTNTFAALDQALSNKNTPAASSCGDTWVQRLQHEFNLQLGAGINEDGIPGPATLNAACLVMQGARGNITQLIQEKLSGQGYDTNGVDGIFGCSTYNAVYQFQENNGVIVDGIVGHDTWAKLLGL